MKQSQSPRAMWPTAEQMPDNSANVPAEEPEERKGARSSSRSSTRLPSIATRLGSGFRLVSAGRVISLLYSVDYTPDRGCWQCWCNGRPGSLV